MNFQIIINFKIILKHVECINILYIWTIYYTYRNDKLIWRKLRVNILAAVFIINVAFVEINPIIYKKITSFIRNGQNIFQPLMKRIFSSHYMFNF